MTLVAADLTRGLTNRLSKPCFIPFIPLVLSSNRLHSPSFCDNYLGFCKWDTLQTIIVVETRCLALPVMIVVDSLLLVLVALTTILVVVLGHPDLEASVLGAKHFSYFEPLD